MKIIIHWHPNIIIQCHSSTQDFLLIIIIIIIIIILIISWVAVAGWFDPSDIETYGLIHGCHTSTSLQHCSRKAKSHQGVKIATQMLRPCFFFQFSRACRAIFNRVRPVIKVDIFFIPVPARDLVVN